MALTADELRKMLMTKQPVNAVFLVPLAVDDCGAMMIQSIAAGESPMVTVKEYSGNERCLSWKAVCEQYEVVGG